MKILILTDGIVPYVTGGMQKHSYMLAKYLAKQGVQIELHHCVYEGELPNHENLFEPQESKNIKVVAHLFPKSIKFPGHYIYRSYLYSNILFESVKNRLNEFDFVYAKGLTGWKLMKAIKNGLMCPPIGVKFHGYEMYQKAPSFKVKLEHYLLRPFVKRNTLHADLVFSYGGKITKIIENLGVAPSQIIEVPSGIEEDFIRNGSELVVNNPRRFVFVGRYERRKGIEELTSALKALIQEDTPFEFHFIGPIPEEKQLKDNRIIYYGKVIEVEEKKRILDQIDVLVCPSHSEGMPNVILEGMARGCAVLATDVGAVGVMVDEKNGKLLHNSSETEISNGLDFFIGLPSIKLEQMKVNSIKRAQSFGWSKIVEETIKKLNSELGV